MDGKGESVETTAIRFQADMKLKEQALAKTDGTEVRLRRYQSHDHLLAFLKSSDNADKLARNSPDSASSRRPRGIIGSRQTLLCALCRRLDYADARGPRRR
jgi:hypothetical protein